MISRSVALLLLFALVYLFQQFKNEVETAPGILAVSLGLVILAGYLCGELGSKIKLPRLTGYILAGIVIGPYCFGLLTHETVGQMKLVDQIAWSMIALSAGGEFNIASIKKRIRGILWITVCQMIGIFCIGSFAFYCITPFIPFLNALPPMGKITAALAFGAIAISQSPAQAIVIVTETKSGGPITETVLGITILIDVIMIMIFMTFVPVLKMLDSGEGGMNWAIAAGLITELAVSVLIGLAAGWFLSLYLRYLQKNPVLFVLAFSYIISEGARALHLDTMIICITAGTYVSNASKQGEELIKMLEDSSLIVYVIFFCITGAKVNLTALQSTFGLALFLVAVRMVSMGISTYCGAVFSRAGYPTPHRMWMLFLPQAGVSLGLLSILTREGFSWGSWMQTLLVAVISINEIIGPILMKSGLSLYGEIGQAKRGKLKSD